MTLREATRSALTMEPDRPGVARLCQELLAEHSGLPVRREPIELVRFHGASSKMLGNRGNRWGRSGRPT